MKKNLILILSSLIVALYSLKTSADEPFVVETDLTKECQPLVNPNYKYTNPKKSGIGKKLYKELLVGMEFFENEKYKQAIVTFKSILQKYPSQDTKARVNKLLAYSYAQLDNVDDAYVAFNKAIEYGKYYQSHEENQMLMRAAASYFYTNGLLNKALSLLKNWAKESATANKDVYLLLAAIYINETIGRDQDAICAVFAGVKIAGKPDKKFFQILKAAHLNLKDYSGTKAILEKMLSLFPDDSSIKSQLKSLENY